MLEEEFEEQSNQSKWFSVVVVVLLVFLMGAAVVIWRTQTARSTGVSLNNLNGYEYAGSQYSGLDGGCGESCGGGSGSGAGCCGGQGSGTEGVSSEEVSELLKKAEKAGVEYYQEKYNDTSVTAKATDYGCHLQVDIYKGNEVVKSLGYDSTSGIYEID